MEDIKTEDLLRAALLTLTTYLDNLNSQFPVQSTKDTPAQESYTSTGFKYCGHEFYIKDERYKGEAEEIGLLMIGIDLVKVAK